MCADIVPLLPLPFSFILFAMCPSLRHLYIPLTYCEGLNRYNEEKSKEKETTNSSKSLRPQKDTLTMFMLTMNSLRKVETLCS